MCNVHLSTSYIIKYACFDAPNMETKTTQLHWPEAATTMRER